MSDWPAVANRGSQIARVAALMAAIVVGLAQAAPASVQSAPVDRPPQELEAGEFIWTPDASPTGPLVMVISLDEQLAYVYRNGLRIGVSTVSTGKKGKETPTGVFTILQKQKVHHSTLYDDAPMPFMQRLTWDGVALHAGRVPGYRASHGCIRLPYAFARRLYDVTSFGMTVVVAAEASKQAELAHPGLFSSIEGLQGIELPASRLSKSQAFAWNPDKSPSGPLTILVGTTSRLVVVIRNGVEIGRARIRVQEGAPIPTQAYVMLTGNTGAPSPVVPDRPGLLWQAIPLPGVRPPAGATLDPDAVRRIALPPEFAHLVYEVMQPGTTLVLTGAPIQPREDQPSTTILDAQDEGSGAVISDPAASDLDNPVH